MIDSFDYRLSIFTLRTCHYGNCYFDGMTKKQMPPPGSRVNFAHQNAKFYFHRLWRLMGLRMMQGSPRGVKVLLIEKMRTDQWNEVPWGSINFETNTFCAFSNHDESDMALTFIVVSSTSKCFSTSRPPKHPTIESGASRTSQDPTLKTGKLATQFDSCFPLTWR